MMTVIRAVCRPLLLPLVVGVLFLGSVSAQTGTNAFASRPALTLSAGVATGTGSNAGATAEAGEPSHLGDPAAKSIWWRWTAPTTGLAQVDAIGTGFNTRLAVYTGNVLASLQLIGANLGSDDAPNFESVVRFQAVAGTAYAICIDGYTDPDTAITEIGAITLSVRQPGAGTRPANDQFSSAAVLPGTASVTVSGTIVSASVEAREPDPEPAFTSLGAARTVWYSWSPPTSGTYTLRIEADEISDWEPAAAVYAGTVLTALTLLDKAENLAFIPSDRERGLLTATFAATAGQALRIQVGGLAFLTSEGTFELSLGPAIRPVLDDFAAAADAGTALTYVGESSLIEGTRQAGEPNHFAGVGGSTSISSSSVWWKWTAPASGAVTVDTRGSDGDTVLAVYRSTAIPATLAALVLVAGADDINFDLDALGAVHTFSATAGSVYYFAVTGYSQGSRVLFHLATGAARAPYAAWLVGFPGLAGAAAEPDADPDGDGLTNLQELMHGTDPLQPSQTREEDESLLPALAVNGSTLVLECGYSNDNLVGLSDGAGVGGLPMIVTAQSSADLRTWTSVPAADVSYGTIIAFVSLPMGSPPGGWIRLEVDDPNP